jgi:hypothetical protein
VTAPGCVEGKFSPGRRRLGGREGVSEVAQGWLLAALAPCRGMVLLLGDFVCIRAGALTKGPCALRALLAVACEFRR